MMMINDGQFSYAGWINCGPFEENASEISLEFLEIAQYALLTQIYFPCIVSLQILWFWKEYWYCIARCVCFPSFVFSDQPVVYLVSSLLHRANALKSPSQSPIEGSSSGEWVQTELLPELPKTLPVRFDELLMSIFPIFVYTLTKYGSRVTIVTFVNCQISKLMFDLALKKQPILSWLLGCWLVYLVSTPHYLQSQYQLILSNKSNVSPGQLQAIAHLNARKRISISSKQKSLECKHSCDELRDNKK